MGLVSLALGEAGFEAGDELVALVLYVVLNVIDIAACLAFAFFGEADVLLETVLLFEGGGGLGGDAGAVEEFFGGLGVQGTGGFSVFLKVGGEEEEVLGFEGFDGFAESNLVGKNHAFGER